MYWPGGAVLMTVMRVITPADADLEIPPVQTLLHRFQWTFLALISLDLKINL